MASLIQRRIIHWGNYSLINMLNQANKWRVRMAPTDDFTEMAPVDKVVAELSHDSILSNSFTTYIFKSTRTLQSVVHKLKNKMTSVAGWESLRTGIHDSENLKQTFLDFSDALSKLSHLLNRAKTIKWYARWMVCGDFLQERRKIRTGWKRCKEFLKLE